MAAVDGPSFDCAKAATEVELAICASDRLSTQDLDLLDAYKAARDSGATTRDDQRSWIRQRNTQCGGNVDCLYQVNQARIDDLNGTGATPQPSNPQPVVAASNQRLADEIQVQGQNYLGDIVELTACNANSDLTNVRAGPSASQFDQVHQFYNGQPVSVIDRVTNEDGYDYYRVVYPLELGAGRLYDKIGFVYHEALSMRCDADFDAVVARNTQWPVSLRGASFDFQIANSDTLDSWADVRSMDWRTANTSENILCDMTDAPSILVKHYQGFIEAEEKHYFMVNMNGCDAQFSIQIDDANEQIIRSWRYDPACLEERNRVQTQPVRNSPDIGIGSLFDFVFGAGIQGLAAVTGTTSADL